MKYRIVFTIGFLFLVSITFATPMTQIKGTAESYIGEEIVVYQIDDYLSLMKTKIASTKVNKDASFSLRFFSEYQRKLRLEVGKNHFYLYTQPNGNYTLSIDENSPYLDQNAQGVEVSFVFIDLDTNDINYKILIFEDSQLNFLKNFNNFSAINSVQFVEKLDSFKLASQRQYERDTNQFFKTYVRFSFAFLDDLAFMGARNEHEKYDFYLKSEKVWYQNDRYMEYIKSFYKAYEARLPQEINDMFYDGVINSSPTLLMRALGHDLNLKNVRLRELIMIKMLGEIYYSNLYPQTNIVTVLDSLSTHALFEANKGIASNIQFRLQDLTPGTKMPEVNFIINQKRKFIGDFAGKHVYFQFVSKDISRSIEDIRLLKPITEKYNQFIRYLTILIVEPDDSLLIDPSSFIKEHNITWEFTALSKDAPTVKRLKIVNYPYYILMDGSGYVVEAPALSPRPNNEYNTIERILFNVERQYKRRNE